MDEINETSEVKVEGEVKVEDEIKVKYVDLPLQFKTIKEEILPKITEIFEAGNFVLGKELKNFEERFAEYCGTKYALGVANGTDALILSLKVLGVGSGDEVITVPNSFIATAGAIIAVGAKPVFVDVREDYNINSNLIEEAITPRTKAIMPVHLTGRLADMEKIMEIAKKYDLFVVEDAAQAAGAKLNDKKAGSFGDVGCFSLHPLKTLNAGGDGGVITTNNQEIYDKLSKLRNHGLRNRDESELWGYNSRLDSIQAALVNLKLKYLNRWNSRVREIASLYKSGLKDVVKVPVDEENQYAIYHTFIIQCEKRNQLQQHLLEKGIKTKIHYPIPLHLQPCATGLGYQEGDFPATEKLAQEILSLPIYPELTNDQVNYVIEEIHNFYKNNVVGGF